MSDESCLSPIPYPLRPAPLACSLEPGCACAGGLRGAGARRWPGSNDWILRDIGVIRERDMGTGLEVDPREAARQFWRS